MRVTVFGDGETEAVGRHVMLVAVQLHEQQVDTRIEQPQVCHVRKALERGPMQPQGEQPHHHGQGGDLAQLDADVEAQDATELDRQAFAQR